MEQPLIKSESIEQPLPSEVIEQLSQWPSIPHHFLKDTEPMVGEGVGEKKAEINPEEATNGTTEEENPALEGHFLTEKVTEDVAIIDSCKCHCHRTQQIPFELNLPFSCSKCAQQFCCKCQFLVHRDFHRGERKYNCKVCDKSYYYKSDLTRHTPVHQNVKPHVCKVCGRSFNQVGHLITHRLVHTGEKPFPCDVCNKPFNRKSNLQKHKMIHTGERPFMCLVCGSRFGRKGDLQRHTMLHTGERPYKCEVCDKSFSQKPHLVSHRSVHTGERPYKCVACEKSFNRKNNLLKHQITKCPALSLKRSDGSDLQLGDLGVMPSSSFFNQFNHIIKSDLDDSVDSKTFYDSLELKPVVTLMDNDSDDILNDPSDNVPHDSSLLRARLSNTSVCVTLSNKDDSVKPSTSESGPGGTVMLSIAFETSVLLKNCEPSNVPSREPSLDVTNQESDDSREVGSGRRVTRQYSVSKDNVSKSPNMLDNSKESHKAV